MRLRLQLVVTSMLLAVFCFATVSSRSWAAGPRLYAWVAAVPGAVLTGTYLARQLLGARKLGNKTASKAAEVSPWREMSQFVWMIAALVSTWLLGFVVTAPLFVFIYTKLNGERWLLTITATVSTVLLVWVFTLMQMEWIQGILPIPLGFFG